VTLQCLCGGPVEVTGANEGPAGRVRETYRCANCGRIGGFAFGGGTPSETWGAVRQ
jgi:hypothetical protein